MSRIVIVVVWVYVILCGGVTEIEYVPMGITLNRLFHN
jgi:hypothetical protein